MRGVGPCTKIDGARPHWEYNHPQVSITSALYDRLAAYAEENGLAIREVVDHVIERAVRGLPARSGR